MARQPDDLAVFARRRSLLASLADGPREKCDLVRELDVSRSTIDRSLRDLESRGYAECVDGGYQLTLRGRLAFAEYRQFADRLETFDRAAPLTTPLPADCPLGTEALVGGEVVLSEPPVPYRPIEHHLQRVREADRVRLLGTVIADQYVRTYYEQVIEGELEVQAAISPSVLWETFATYEDRMVTGLDTGRVTLRELPEPPPFSLFVLDGDERRVGVMVYGDEGVRGYVDNDRPAAVDWGERTFERYWERAEPLGVE